MGWMLVFVERWTVLLDCSTNQVIYVLFIHAVFRWLLGAILGEKRCVRGEDYP
jgi:hypothetical protein